MPDLNKEEIEKDYRLMCEVVAEDIRNGCETVDEVAEYIIDVIKNQNHLSDFEKIVRDYFKVNNLELSVEVLKRELKEYL